MRRTFDLFVSSLEKLCPLLLAGCLFSFKTKKIKYLRLTGYHVTSLVIMTVLAGLNFFDSEISLILDNIYLSISSIELL